MTATFKILSGKALKNAIAGYGKTATTFAERTHQLAYSAINHVDEHNCASHINALYQATPTNYRGALRTWACYFGKVKFVTETMTFEYNKSAKSDLQAALETSPAEFQRQGKKGAKTATPLIDRLEKMIEKELASETGDHAMAKKLQSFLKAQSAPKLEVVKPKRAVKAKKPQQIPAPANTPANTDEQAAEAA